MSNRTASRAVSLALAAALCAVSPGLEPYRLLAETVRAADAVKSGPGNVTRINETSLAPMIHWGPFDASELDRSPTLGRNVLNIAPELNTKDLFLDPIIPTDSGHLAPLLQRNNAAGENEKSLPNDSHGSRKKLAEMHQLLENNPRWGTEQAYETTGRPYDGSDEKPKSASAEVAVPEPSFAADPPPGLKPPSHEIEVNSLSAADVAAPVRTRRPIKDRLWEYADSSVVSIVSMLGSMLAYGIFGRTIAFPVSLGILWATNAAVMRRQLESLRAVVVGGWQASHDQRYRVGPNGRLRDVRGNSYGQDRYEKYAPGKVTMKELAGLYFFSRALGVVVLLLTWESSAPFFSWKYLAPFVYYLASFLGIAAPPFVRHLLHGRHSARPAELDDESKAHATRFN